MFFSRNTFETELESNCEKLQVNINKAGHHIVKFDTTTENLTPQNTTTKPTEMTR